VSDRPNVPVSARLPVVLPLRNGPLPGVKSSALIRVKVQPKRNVVLAVQFPSAALTLRLTREVRRAVVLRPVVRWCLPEKWCLLRKVAARLPGPARLPVARLPRLLRPDRCRLVVCVPRSAAI
jgi:hypothetical protein